MRLGRPPHRHRDPDRLNGSANRVATGTCRARALEGHPKGLPREEGGRQRGVSHTTALWDAGAHLDVQPAAIARDAVGARGYLNHHLELDLGRTRGSTLGTGSSSTSRGWLRSSFRTL